MTENANEEAQRRRRETLAAYISAHFGSVNAFATALDRKQPQISETLKGARSFGEKLARALETEVDTLRRRAEWKHLPPLQFDASSETHPKLAALIRHFESIKSEETQDLLLQIAGTMANKSGEEAATTQVGRDFPARDLGALQSRSKATPKKHRRA